MRIRDWSSDVCSSDLAGAPLLRTSPAVENPVAAWHQEVRDTGLKLSRKIGRAAEIRLSKAHKDDQALRLRKDAAWIADHYEPLARTAPGLALRKSVAAAQHLSNLPGEAISSVGLRSEEHTYELQSLLRL